MTRRDDNNAGGVFFFSRSLLRSRGDRISHHSFASVSARPRESVSSTARYAETLLARPVLKRRRMGLVENIAPDAQLLGNVWEQPVWYALYTKPCREVFAAANVRDLGLEVFLPRIQRAFRGRRRRATRMRPLFPGYIFARMQPANDLHAVRNTPGVVHIVSSCNQPAPVPDEIIAGLSQRLNDDGCLLVTQDALRAGDEVTIGDGPLRGLIARFERECDDGVRVMLLLNAIGHARVCIDKDCLQPAL
jgi:transcriptional antiterminator RfaH